MSRVKLFKQRSIDVAINVTTGSVNFPMQDDLLNAFIVAIDVFTTNDIGTVSPATQQTVMSVADMKLCNVNLWREDKQVTFNLPLLNLHSMTNTSDPYIRDQYELDFVKISWTKCTINIAGTLSSAATVIPLSVYYLKEEDVKTILANDVMFEKVRQQLAQ